MPRRLFCGGLGLAALAKTAWAAAVDANAVMRPGDPVLGNPRGDLTIVDFYDIRCPPCRAMEPRFKKLLAADRAIRYVPVDYPILGAASELGARALYAAQLQNEYANLRDDLMSEASPPTETSIAADAKILAIDWPRMEIDMNGDGAAARVAANLERGRALGLQGIPAIFIGPIFVPGELGDDDLVSVVAMARARQNAKPA